jgi:Mrp family chromosome partitioning ATPase
MDRIGSVKHIILVLSGKGGVGKSTLSAELAISLQHIGYKVGILDIDLTGPSMPELFHLSDAQIYQSDNGWIPVYTDPSKTMGLVSLGFLLKNRDEPVIWRGPKKNAMITQFINDVVWDCDVLVIDTPPGTSDEHISIVQQLKEYHPSAVLVTTPQLVSIADVRREITFCKKVGVPILGLVENMSGFVCPHCEECTNVFSSGGGKALAHDVGIPYWGNVPIDPTLTTERKFADVYKESKVFDIVNGMVANLVKEHFN